MTKKNERKTLTITLDERRYKGLQFEARLLKGVFGIPFTPEDVAEARLEEQLMLAPKQFGRPHE